MNTTPGHSAKSLFSRYVSTIIPTSRLVRRVFLLLYFLRLYLFIRRLFGGLSLFSHQVQHGLRIFMPVLGRYSEPLLRLGVVHRDAQPLVVPLANVELRCDIPLLGKRLLFFSSLLYLRFAITIHSYTLRQDRAAQPTSTQRYTARGSHTCISIYSILARRSKAKNTAVDIYRNGEPP